MMNKNHEKTKQHTFLFHRLQEFEERKTYHFRNVFRKQLKMVIVIERFRAGSY